MQRSVCPCLLFLSAVLGRADQQPPPKPTPDERIDYYTRKLTADPKLYPVYVQLAVACFDKAKDTHDPSPLARAEEALLKSIEIQPNLPAYAALSALCNYRHRFAEALEWGRKVLESEPNDSAVIAGMVEAYLALGEGPDAEKLLATRADGTGDFHLAAARGVLLKSQGKKEEAAAAFARAADAAKARKVNDLIAWALVQIAGVWIDSGQAGRAVPFLEQAAQLDPLHVELKIHQAEVLEARGQLLESLAAYEELLSRSNDPFLHAKAYELAREIGDADRADRHFAFAEQGLKRPIDVGEVYTLGALARLYLAAGARLPEALELAKRNAHHQKDASSQELIEQIEHELRATSK